jgi:hypothetical protein
MEQVKTQFVMDVKGQQDETQKAKRKSKGTDERDRLVLDQLTNEDFQVVKEHAGMGLCTGLHITHSSVSRPG